MEEATFSINGITFHWRNTMLGAIQTAVMDKKFSSDDLADSGARWQFCQIMAYAESVEGLDKIGPSRSQDEFDSVYAQLAGMVTYDGWMEIVRALNDLKEPKADQIEKPDSALTPEEEADPN